MTVAGSPVAREPERLATFWLEASAIRPAGVTSGPIVWTAKRGRVSPQLAAELQREAAPSFTDSRCRLPGRNCVPKVDEAELQSPSRPRPVEPRSGTLRLNRTDRAAGGGA